MTIDRNLDRTVDTPCGETIHLGGLAALLQDLGRIPAMAAYRAFEEDLMFGADDLEGMIESELGGVPSHPAIDPSSNVVSIFRERS